MKITAIIPARYSSSRFPGKPLAFIKGKPMIQWVYERAQKAKRIDGIYVATDDDRIFEAVSRFGGDVIMTSDRHTCGTDRIAECANKLNMQNEDIVLNIQGDEPMIKPEMIDDLITIFDDPDVYMGTLKKAIESEDEKRNSNIVKVITDKDNNALYFSRFCIPFDREGIGISYYKHIGCYGYKKWFLDKFCNMEKTSLELAESLEQLRVLENGFRIKVKETQYQTIGVDIPQQVKLVEKEIEELI